jgi:uncharacterized protein (UPF0371 family)
MGVNRAGFAVTNDAVCCEASRQEVIRRYFRCACEQAMGFVTKDTVERSQLLMEDLGAGPLDRRVVAPAREAAQEARTTGKGNKGIFCGAAIELAGGRIVTGKNSPLMHASASLVMNAIKTLAEIPERLHLLSPSVIQSITSLKQDILRAKSVSMDLEEALIALSISAATSPTAQMAMDKLKELHGCEVHMTHIPRPGDEAGLRRLGVNLTCEPSFSTHDLFQS